jgi:probable rRNA maturation factor
VSVEINNESGMAADEDALRELAQYVIGQMETHPLADLSMLLVDEAHMTNLHEKWMDEPGPTDVLSFPMDELRPHSMAGPNRSRGRESDEPEPVLLGDVVLCPQVAAVQARQHGQSTQAELELLTVHGVLHLLGYDHADPEDEAEMFGLQNELLRDWRLEYPARAASAAPAPAPADPASAEPAAVQPKAAAEPAAAAAPAGAEPSSADPPSADPPSADPPSAEPPATQQPAADDKAAGRPASGEGPEGPALCPPPPGCWSSPSC